MPTLNIMQTIRQVRRATVDARARLGDQTIGTRADSGRLQVVRVTYPAGKRGRADVAPISDWLAPADVVAYLGAMQ